MAVEQLFRRYIDGDLADELDFDRVEYLATERTGPGLARSMADLVCRIHFRGSSRYLLFSAEFHSAVDRYMSLRALFYIAAAYRGLVGSKRRRTRLGPRGRLPPTLTVTIYNGRRPWTAPADIFDLIEPVQGRLAERQPRLRHQVLDLRELARQRLPSEISRFFHEVMARTGNADGVVFSTHCHDDLGLAVANSLAAVLAGVRQVECTINGIGERAGNASLEEIVMATRVRRDLLPYTTDVDTTRLFRTSRLLSELTGEPVQANKAIVGRNAFAHEAGIHQHGMIRDRRTYEIMRPEDVGVESTLVLGKHSGRHAVKRRCEGLGFDLGRDEVDRVYREVIALADRGRTVGDDELVGIVRRSRAGSG